ncbi:MAG: hypothetical protein M1816_007534 [Peltula sp. TS41687]|nr:MAG: hypothetical protein M1816_007534 [Peltula sp. TS41687]
MSRVNDDLNSSSSSIPLTLDGAFSGVTSVSGSFTSEQSPWTQQLPQPSQETRIARPIHMGNGPANSLSRFYEDKDGPWTPHRLIAESQASTAPLTQIDPGSNIDPSALFNGVTRNPARSEIGSVATEILPSDSGYASKSGATLSVISSDISESGRIHGSISSQATIWPDSQPWESSLGPSGQSNPPSQVGSKDGLRCNDCECTFRYGSELKYVQTLLLIPSPYAENQTCASHRKHHLRHQRPFLCGESGCEWATKGFTTRNDLDRHIRSVHIIQSQQGQVKAWCCASTRCKTKTKIWPRLDNFRNHIKRLHPEEDREDLIQRSEEKARAGFSSSDLALPDLGTPSEFSQDLVLASQPDCTRHTSSELASPWGFLLPNYQAEVEDPNGVTFSFNTSVANEEQASADASHATGLPPRPSRPSLSNVDAQGFLAIPNARISQDYARWQAARNRPDDENHIQAEISRDAISDQRHQKSPLDPDAEEDFESTLHHSVAPRDHLPDTADENPTLVFEDHHPIDTAKLIKRLAKSAVAQLTTAALKENPDHSSRLRYNQRSQPTQEKDHPERQPLANNSSLDMSDENDLIVELDHSHRASTKEQTEHGRYLRMTCHKSIELQIEQSLHALLEQLRLHGRQTQDKMNKNYSEFSEDSSQQTKLICDYCQKIFQSRSLFKKHEKRHLKPYFCTYPECHKTFGSKDDWKRHENSQHFQLEVWKCQEPLNASEGRPCGEDFYRRELFQQHLRQHHRIVDLKRLKSAAQPCRIDAPQLRVLQRWCGFCTGNITLLSQGLAAWDERFNHIEKHIKDGKRIDTWIPFNESIANSSDRRVLSDAARSEVDLDDDEDSRPSRMTPLGEHGWEGGQDLTMRRDRSLPNGIIPGPASPQPPGEDGTRHDGGSKKHSRAEDGVGENTSSKVARMDQHPRETTEVIFCVSGSYKGLPGPSAFLFLIIVRC